VARNEESLRERGAVDRFVLETSLYQRANIHPFVTAGILLLGGGLALAAWLGSGTGQTERDDSKRGDGLSRRQTA